MSVNTNHVLPWFFRLLSWSFPTRYYLKWTIWAEIYWKKKKNQFSLLYSHALFFFFPFIGYKSSSKKWKVDWGADENGNPRHRSSEKLAFEKQQIGFFSSPSLLYQPNSPLLHITVPTHTTFTTPSRGYCDFHLQPVTRPSYCNAYAIML